MTRLILFALGGGLTYGLVTLLFTLLAAYTTEDQTVIGGYVFSLFMTIPISVALGIVFGIWLSAG